MHTKKKKKDTQESHLIPGEACPPRKQCHLSKRQHSRKRVQWLLPLPSPTWQLYLSPHWSSIYGTTLLAAGHSSSLSWLAPGSRRLSHCRAGTHHPHASLSACSFQPEILHNIILYTVLTFMFLQNRQQQVNHCMGREHRPFWRQLWHSLR